MKLNSLLNLLYIGSFTVILTIISACSKSTDSSGADVCTNVKKVKIKTSKTSYYIGESISLKTNITPDGNYSWYQSQSLGVISTGTSYYVSYCDKSNSGWYYLNVSNSDCNNVGRDSVLINVINKPDSAPCTPTNNTASFSSIPSISFSSPSWGLDPNYSIKLMRGYQDMYYPDINVYFDNYWNTHEPEDGAYSMAGLFDLSSGGSDVYRVAIQSLYSSIQFAADSGKVYVSHPGGKMCVTFCNIPMSGYWGNTVNTVVSGKMTAP